MARPPPSTPPRRSRTAVAPVRARSVVTDSGSLQNAFSSYFPYASSSYDPARFLPSLASLQAWVYRPDAVAKCFTSDVLNLRALKSDDGDVQYKSSGEWERRRGLKVEVPSLFTFVVIGY